MPTIQELLPLPPIPFADGPMAEAMTGVSGVMNNILSMLLMPANAIFSLLSGSSDAGIRERFDARTGASPEQLAAAAAAQQAKSRKTGFSTTGDTIMF